MEFGHPPNRPSSQSKAPPGDQFSRCCDCLPTFEVSAVDQAFGEVFLALTHALAPVTSSQRGPWSPAPDPRVVRGVALCRRGFAGLGGEALLPLLPAVAPVDRWSPPAEVTSLVLTLLRLILVCLAGLPSWLITAPFGPTVAYYV